MITDKENNWHYLAVKSISRLFRRITSNNNGDHYYLNCLHSYRTEKKLKVLERLCNNHDYSEIIMATKYKNIVKYNSGEKSLKIVNVIYFDLETLHIKQQSVQNNPIRSCTEIKTIHEVCGYLLALETSYGKRTHKFYRGKDCVERFSNDLRTLAMKVINTEKKEMTRLTNRQESYYESREYCHICRKKFCSDENHKNYHKYRNLRAHDHYTGDCT